MKPKFTSVQQAAEHILLEIDDGREAWEYLLENAPGLREAMHQKMRELFPDLRPAFYDDSGNPYYEISGIEKALSVSRDEIISTVQDDVRIFTGNKHTIQ